MWIYKYIFLYNCQIIPSHTSITADRKKKRGKKRTTLTGESAAGKNIPSADECVWIEVAAWAGLPVEKAAPIS